MPATESFVYDAWIRLGAALAIPEGKAEEVWQIVKTAYGEPQRHYHTLDHIAAVLRNFDRLRPRFQKPESTGLALLFHDVVYDPSRQDNEARSADLMNTLLAGQLDTAITDHACHAIRATQHHRLDDDADTNRMLDIDMSILGAPWAHYRAYAEGVAREYLPVYGFEAYAVGRAELFLKPTLARPHIFLTEDFAGLDGQAQDNLRREQEMWQDGGFAFLKTGL